jgi:vancomycin resistance protein YoaR
MDEISAGNVRLAGYATSLRQRSPSQSYNARLAARALDGQLIQPGAIFSFNRCIKSWTIDGGYRKAPVSYNGELVRAFGGGVCQTSTTLYNAALLAGLPIVERHHHVFAPHYINPGRDAAVAQYSIDLRFRNPYPWPVRIKSSATDDSLQISIFGQKKPDLEVHLETQILRVSQPERLTEVITGNNASGKSYLRCPGAQGYRVLTWRTYTLNGKEIKREEIGDDSYDALDRVIALTETTKGKD